MMTFDEQIAALSQMVPQWAIQSAKEVRGKFTSGDYVEYTLRQIFGPESWSFTILAGPTLVTISEVEAYAQVTGRLTATFANGKTVTQDAIGVWPLRATRAGSGGTLENGTSAERYETVLKACCTDSLKAAAERIGSCFRPMSDLALTDHITRESLRGTDCAEHVANASAKELTEELFGVEKKSNVNRWIMDDNTRAGFWAGVRDKGLTHDFVHKALKVDTLKDYSGSITDAWKVINAAIDGAIAREKPADGAFDTREQQKIPF